MEFYTIENQAFTSVGKCYSSGLLLLKCCGCFIFKVVAFLYTPKVFYFMGNGAGECLSTGMTSFSSINMHRDRLIKIDPLGKKNSTLNIYNGIFSDTYQND